MIGYLPWWQGALGLGGITVGYYLALGRTLGISGAWERVLHWRDERATEALDAGFEDHDAFAAALEAATLEALGAKVATTAAAQPRRLAPHSPELFERVPAAAVKEPVAFTAVADASSAPAPGASPIAGRPTPVAAQATLLVSVLLGGILAAVVSGRFELRADMGDEFANLVVSGPAMWPVLFIGGLLVGFGTRLAGGCSSGHGLSGCSRFQPASIVATAVFFGSAVVVSTLLWKVI